jgi:hypothetical protein
LILIQFFLALIGIRHIRSSKLLIALFTTSHVRGTARSKKAATSKINAVLANAQNLNLKSTFKHNSLATKEEMITNFVLRGESFEECGGLSWTWTRLLSGALFDEEGIWIASRLIIIQTAQLCLIGFFLYAGLLLVEEATEQAAQAQEALEPGYPDWVYDIVPTPKQVKTALYPALGVAIFVMITLFLVYIPRCVCALTFFVVGMWLTSDLVMLGTQLCWKDYPVSMRNFAFAQVPRFCQVQDCCRCGKLLMRTYHCAERVYV